MMRHTDIATSSSTVVSLRPRTIRPNFQHLYLCSRKVMLSGDQVTDQFVTHLVNTASRSILATVQHPADNRDTAEHQCLRSILTEREAQRWLMRRQVIGSPMIVVAHRRRRFRDRKLEEVGITLRMNVVYCPIEGAGDRARLETWLRALGAYLSGDTDSMP